MRIALVNLTLSALVICAAWLVLATDRLWPFLLPAMAVPLAWPLLAVGTFLITWAVATFVREAHVTGAVGNTPDRLVTLGPFRHLRNPIYFGLSLLLLAISFQAQSPSFLLVATAFPLLIDVYVRHIEEPRLERRFGEAYRQYCRKVPRWIPKRRSD